VGANDPITSVDDGTESTEDLHLLRDGLAECEDECRGLSNESPDDDSDVVVDTKSNSLPRSQQLTRPIKMEESRASKELAHKNGEIAGSGEMCSGEDISSGESESKPE
ncbi:hypothetical protein Tco_1048960, partial [Tanacetum coccineum]